MIGVGFRLELYFSSQKIHSSLPNYKTSTDTPEFVLAVTPFFPVDPPFFNRLTLKIFDGNSLSPKIG